MNTRPLELKQAGVQGWRLAVLALLFAACNVSAQVYRWVDDKGQVHYSDSPSKVDRAKAQRLPPTPSAPAQAAASSPTARTPETPPARKAAPRAVPSDSVHTLGPLPASATSEWMHTTSSGVAWDSHAQPYPTYQFSLLLRLRQDVPSGAYLEARFENPGDPARPLLVTASVAAGTAVKADSLLLLTPPIDAIGCRNYRVEVRLFRSVADRALLGIHQQVIQSRIDSSLYMAQLEKPSNNTLLPNALCPR